MRQHGISSGGEYWRAGLATLSERAVAEASDRQANVQYVFIIIIM